MDMIYDTDALLGNMSKARYLQSFEHYKFTMNHFIPTALYSVHIVIIIVGVTLQLALRRTAKSIGGFILLLVGMGTYSILEEDIESQLPS
jgi:hypothetical protein